MENFVGIMNLIQRTPWIRVGHWIDIYDVKTRLTHGRHGVGAEQKNSLEKKMIEHPAWLIKKKIDKVYIICDQLPGGRINLLPIISALT